MIRYCTEKSLLGFLSTGKYELSLVKGKICQIRPYLCLSELGISCGKTPAVVANLLHVSAVQLGVSGRSVLPS